MSWQRLAFVGGKLALAINLETAIVDLKAVDHADVLGSCLKLDTRSPDPLFQSRRTWHGATVRQLLAARHPLTVLLGLLGQILTSVAKFRQPGAAAVIIHFGTDRSVQSILIDTASGHDRFCSFFGNITATGVGGSWHRKQNGCSGKNCRYSHHHSPGPSLQNYRLPLDLYPIVQLRRNRGSRPASVWNLITI